MVYDLGFIPRGYTTLKLIYGQSKVTQVGAHVAYCRPAMSSPLISVGVSVMLFFSTECSRSGGIPIVRVDRLLGRRIPRPQYPLLRHSVWLHCTSGRRFQAAAENRRRPLWFQTAGDTPGRPRHSFCGGQRCSLPLTYRGTIATILACMTYCSSPPCQIESREKASGLWQGSSCGQLHKPQPAATRLCRVRFPGILCAKPRTRRQTFHWRTTGHHATFSKYLVREGGRNQAFEEAWCASSYLRVHRTRGTRLPPNSSSMAAVRKGNGLMPLSRVFQSGLPATARTASRQAVSLQASCAARRTLSTTNKMSNLAAFKVPKVQNEPNVCLLFYHHSAWVERP